MEYSLLKAIHVSCVGITYVLFFGRGVLMLTESLLVRTRFLRIAPHVNDTVLLASAISMLVLTRRNPFLEGWLTAKIVALLVYIGLGMVALSGRGSKRRRLSVWILAQLVFAYIVLVALTRSPAPISFG